MCLLCYDEAGAKSLGAMITHADFDLYYRDIAEQALAYRVQYKAVPGEHTRDLVEVCKARDAKDAEFYDRIFHSMEQTRTGGINREWVLASAGTFARRQRIKRGATRMIELLQRGTDEAMDEAEAAMQEAFKASTRLFDPGTFLTDPAALNFLNEEESETFPVGVREFDDRGIGPARKTMFLMMALTNRGKTWGAIHIGKTGLRHRKRVCHITTEMSAEKVLQRYMQSLFALTKREATVVVSRLECDDLGKIVTFSEEELKDRKHFRSPRIRATLAAKLEALKHRAPPLVVKEFPTGFLTIDGLKRYLDGLEGHGFLPDEVIIDSPDLMDVDASSYRHSIGKIYQQVRGIGGERNMAMIVTTQAHRAALSQRVLTEANVGEDFSKVQTADTGVSYNQTDSEYKRGLARLFAFRVREEQKHLMVVLSQAYPMGQFCLGSTLMSGNYWNEVEGRDREEEEAGDDDE